MNPSHPILADPLDRRRFLAGLGAAAAGLAVVGPRGVVAQDQATPAPAEGPPPQATPQLGPRADGTTVWRVQVGAEDDVTAVEVMAFLPDPITIAAGDTIFFDIRGFHTVSFLAGAPRLPLLIPDPEPGTPVAAPPDGTPQLIINPAAAFPSGGPAVDGTGVVNSGVPLDPSAPPVTFTFPKEGSFADECLVHPKMKGTVVVQAKGATLPHTQADYDQAIAQAQAQAVTRTQELAAPHAQAAATPGANGATTWEILAGVGDDTTMLAKFLPDSLSIKVGDTVRWRHGGGGDPHTVTFLGGEQPPDDTIIVPQAGGPPKIVQSPLTFVRQGGDVFSGTRYHNSGYLGVDASLVGWSGYQPTDTYELTFDTAGEYSFYCILHSQSPTQGMNGKIIVS
jgi:plastocyanin